LCISIVPEGNRTADIGFHIFSLDGIAGKVDCNSSLLVAVLLFVDVYRDIDVCSLVSRINV